MNIIAHIFVLSVVFLSAVFSQPILQLNVHQAGGVKILQAVFHYNGAKLSGYSIFDAENFLLNTVHMSQAPGGVLRSDYFDGVGNLDRYNFEKKNGPNGILEFFTPFNEMITKTDYQKSADNVFVTSNGQIIQYIYNQEKLAKIEIKSNIGQLSHFAVPLYQLSNAKRNQMPALSSIRSLKRLPNGGLEIFIFLNKNTQVHLTRHRLDGRFIDMPINTKLYRGFHNLSVKPPPYLQPTVVSINIGQTKAPIRLHTFHR